MKKAPEAFRTISEVAEILETPAHVLRFWESKFYQIRPVKRAGGRRYYRPDDVALISGIKALLQDKGMTIRGVQRVLQEQGVRHVASLAGPLPALEIGGAIEVFDEAGETGDLAGLVGPEVDEAEQVSDGSPEPVEDAVIPFPAAAQLAEPRRPADAPADPVEDAALPLDALFAPQDSVSDAEEPPAGTVTGDDEDPAERLDIAPATTPDITPDQPAGPVASDSVTDAADRGDALEPSDRALLARRLRSLPRGSLGARRDRAELLARRIDSLLERMSEASGAGRW